MTATKVLRDEHEGILVMLDVLGVLVRQARGHKLDRGDAAKAVDFFRSFADRCHHGKEEKHLFPALTRAGMRVEQGPIGVMLAEHERGRALVKEMAAALGDPGPAGERAFAAAAAGYKDLLTVHIGKENQVLFPQAERILAERDKELLNEAYEEVERVEMGEGTHERYHAMIEEMAARYLGRREDAGCGH